MYRLSGTRSDGRFVKSCWMGTGFGLIKTVKEKELSGGGRNKYGGTFQPVYLLIYQPVYYVGEHQLTGPSSDGGLVKSCRMETG